MTLPMKEVSTRPRWYWWATVRDARTQGYLEGFECPNLYQRDKVQAWAEAQAAQRYPATPIDVVVMWDRS